jgi:hypothetical protein
MKFTENEILNEILNPNRDWILRWMRKNRKHEMYKSVSNYLNSN